MSDEVDMANDRAEMELARAIASVAARGIELPAGTAGECDDCGEWSGRLISGLCAPCRDSYDKRRTMWRK